MINFFLNTEISLIFRLVTQEEKAKEEIKGKRRGKYVLWASTGSGFEPFTFHYPKSSFTQSLEKGSGLFFPLFILWFGFYFLKKD